MIDWCPFAVKLPISRNWDSRDGVTPSLLCDHIADGYGSPWRWFDRVPVKPDTGSSAHFWISKAGKIEQYVPVSGRAWSNGPKDGPDLGNPVVARIVAAPEGRNNPNQYTISKEHEGKPGEVWPRVQVEASARLDAWLATNNSITLDAIHKVGHFQFDKVTRANCPGPTWPKALIMELARAQAAARPGLTAEAKARVETDYFGPLWRIKDLIRAHDGHDALLAPHLLDLAQVIEDKVVETKIELGLQ
jgi:hypothetical protein